MSPLKGGISSSDSIEGVRFQAWGGANVPLLPGKWKETHAEKEWLLEALGRL
jgi:hypothetical protein